MDLEVGARIGDFEIEGSVGAGGMGIVYRARQLSLDRVVALKILGPALNSEAGKARFRREAQAIAKLNHPGIASVYFIGPYFPHISPSISRHFPEAALSSGLTLPLRGRSQWT